MATMRSQGLAWSKVTLGFLMLAGCASYRAEPLPSAPRLAPSVAALDRTIPALGPGQLSVTLDPAGAFTIDQIGLLAILNDPDLASERGQTEQARAILITAATLPNPSLSAGFAALISGPGSTPSYAVALTQDVTSLITYRPRVAAARAGLGAVNAQLLWQEWQVAQQARLLAVQIYGGAQEIRYQTQEASVLSRELHEVQQAAAVGNLDLHDEAPLSADLAAAATALAAANLTYLQNWQDLDALLGLQPDVRFAITRPQIARLPADLTPLLKTLPARRPDLVALQLGYKSSDEALRAAILAQFPAFSVGPVGGTDTTNVLSIGPQMTIDIPIFDRNQGGVSAAEATRAVLHAQYQAALDSSEGTVRSLTALLAVLQDDLANAQNAAAAAESSLADAQRAYAQGSLDQRSLADYETAALERQLEAVDLRTQLDSDSFALEVELGLGLPQTRIAPQVDAGGAPMQQVTHS